MNRTMLGVISLAVGAVLIIGLFNIYRPEVSNLSHDVFNKVPLSSVHMGWPKQPQGLKNGYVINNYAQLQKAEWHWYPKGKTLINGQPNHQDVWQLVPDGDAHNPSSETSHLPLASMNGSSGQLFTGTTASANGQPMGANQNAVTPGP